MTSDVGKQLDQIEHYDFELPKELIAQNPLPKFSILFVAIRKLPIYPLKEPAGR